MKTYALTIFRGITFGPILISCKDINGNALDLTGYIPFAEVREDPDSEVVLNLQPSITNALNGVVTIAAIQDEDTLQFEVGTFTWDFILQKPSGERIGPFVGGPFAIESIITQPPE